MFSTCVTTVKQFVKDPFNQGLGCMASGQIVTHFLPISPALKSIQTIANVTLFGLGIKMNETMTKKKLCLFGAAIVLNLGALALSDHPNSADARSLSVCALMYSWVGGAIIIPRV